MKAIVYGADKSNYNYKKIEGFVNALSALGYETFHYSKSLTPEQLKSHGVIDLFFTESDILYQDYTNVRNIIFWTNFKINNIINLALKHPALNIILAPKSYMYDININHLYSETFKTYDYQCIGFEGQNLLRINSILDKSEKKNDVTYKILDNLHVVYMPCALAEKQDMSSIQESKYKFVYFGTGNNRPGILKIANYLSNHSDLKNKIKFNFVENGKIDPEQCILYYKQAQYVLHEQVQPVILEYPVRMGEAAACGCNIIMIEKLPLYETVSKTKLIPQTVLKFKSADEIITSIDKLPEISLQERKTNAMNFVNTYINSIRYITKFLVT